MTQFKRDMALGHALGSLSHSVAAHLSRHASAAEEHYLQGRNAKHPRKTGALKAKRAKRRKKH